MNPEEIYKLISEKSFNISTDTRALSPGDIYIGIKGENFDGNMFVSQALEKGALYAITDLEENKNINKSLFVENTRETLEELAKIHRSQFSIPIIAIGGSNGKTTTKELISAVLQKKYKVHTTKGNFNNDIGLPLTILAMPLDTEIAVIEIGANHLEEHTKLLNIFSPTYVLVTNNGADHLEGFGSLAGVRKANKEIYDWAQENNAKTFVNKNISDLIEDSKDNETVIYPSKDFNSKSSLYAGVTYDGQDFSSSLFGSYNEPNILAAIAVGEYFDVNVKDIQEAVASYEPTLKRSQIINGGNYKIILDCYNANPSSMELALKDFFRQTKNGERIIITGDMFEMGEEEQMVHKEILDLLEKLREEKDVVIVVGPRFYQSKDNFPFMFYKNTTDAKDYFDKLDIKNKTIFVKASRGMKLEELIKEKIPS
ncbi:MAG: UDP-N-acetylmuramoyl-tripeptide--D-alanyl-D-alanine ligase [Candidatus Pacebacteria bacterium]|nr:UDP-N-acetylmuramoyl-tripeptide--D-alanyl-D-alanine ligase [Candidatus Paceibacterota bacterium]